MNQATHYYEPERADMRGAGNLAACCARPESEHPTWTDDTVVMVELTKPLTSLRAGVFPKGTRFMATRESLPTIVILKESRWGTTPDGRMVELERSEVADVRVKAWSIRIPGEDWSTAIGLKQAKEVLAP